MKFSGFIRQKQLFIMLLNVKMQTSVCNLTFEPHHEKPWFCICENKGADQLRGNREADQRLCFRYADSTIPRLPVYEISSL